MTWFSFGCLLMMLVLPAGLCIMLWATGGNKRNPQAFDALKGITILGIIVWMVIFLYKLHWPASAGNTNDVGNAGERGQTPSSATLTGPRLPSAPPRRATPQEPPPEEEGIIVRADAPFVNTGITVRKGELVNIIATGKVRGGLACVASQSVGPDGWGEGTFPYFDDGRTYLVEGPQGSFMALCYKIGRGPWKHAGSNCWFITEDEGTLFLSTNEVIRDWKGNEDLSYRKDNQGSFRVKIDIGVEN